MLKLGTEFFDIHNARYLTVDGVGADPHLYMCIQEEWNDNNELEITRRAWFTESELEKMERV